MSQRSQNIFVIMLLLAITSVGAACSQEDPDGDDAGGAMGTAGDDAKQEDSGQGGGAGNEANDASTDDDAGATDSSVAETDAGADADYFPLIDGSTFVYRHKNGSAERDDETKIEAITYKKMKAFSSTGSEDTGGEISSNVFWVSGSKVYRIHKDTTINGANQGSVDYKPGFLRFDSAWLGQKVGKANTETYQRIEYNPSGTIVDDDMRTHTFTIESLSETLTVPAGKLKNCIRVSRKRMLTAGATAGDDDDKTLWFCPGVGKAKELTVSSGATEELASCKIPGRACP